MQYTTITNNLQCLSWKAYKKHLFSSSPKLFYIMLLPSIIGSTIIKWSLHTSLWETYLVYYALFAAGRSSSQYFSITTEPVFVDALGGLPARCPVCPGDYARESATTAGIQRKPYFSLSAAKVNQCGLKNKYQHQWGGINWQKNIILILSAFSGSNFPQICRKTVLC